MGGVAKVVASVAISTALGPVGGAVAGALGAAEGTIANAVISKAVTGAISGGVTSGVSGGDVGKGVLFGGISGGVSGGTTSLLTGTPTDPGPLSSSPTLAKSLGTATGGTVGSLASGADIGTALKTGAVGGLTTAATETFAPKGSDLLSSAERGLISSGVSRTLSSALGLDKTQAPTQMASTSFIPSTGSITTTGQGATTPGTQALGQALRVDPTATLGGGKDESKPTENVWNVASLRVKDETGA